MSVRDVLNQRSTTHGSYEVNVKNFAPYIEHLKSLSNQEYYLGCSMVAFKCARAKTVEAYPHHDNTVDAIGYATLNEWFPDFDLSNGDQYPTFTELAQIHDYVHTLLLPKGDAFFGALIGLLRNYAKAIGEYND